ncbi:hypothetical protein EYZ11_000587 [Aspergillus tanneri]|uniref:Uncharacterized protein n=1 Tax=Aspergillus tanneri TaxID=1220188 RepID=A0A4S3JWM1_9EURO|nr:hypothetical protein EYZ11_000587 [Aspergillus tanneri]
MQETLNYAFDVQLMEPRYHQTNLRSYMFTAELAKTGRAQEQYLRVHHSLADWHVSLCQRRFVEATLLVAVKVKPHFFRVKGLVG